MNKNVALVLSSGGARGVAHIGVIRELEECGYTITSVSGTSIGAVIGGFYAAGKLDEYAQWVSSLGLYNVFNLIDFSFSAKGLIKGERVFRKMSEWMIGVTFEDLNIPFVCVAADLKNRKEVILNKGDVLESIRASIAIPGYIEPLLMNDVYLYDGGIINPIPVSCVPRTGDEMVVAVDLNAYMPEFNPKEYWKTTEPEASPTLKKVSALWLNAVNHIELLQRKTSNEEKEKTSNHNIHKHLTHIGALNEMFELMQENVSEESLRKYPPDVLIRIPRNLCNTFEFHRSKELIAYGRQQAKLALEQCNV